VFVDGLLEIFLGELYGGHGVLSRNFGGDRLAAVYSSRYVCRPFRPVADRAIALRFAGRGTCELYGGAARERQVAVTHGGPRPAARAARRRRRDPARTRDSRPRLGWRGRISEPAYRALSRSPRRAGNAHLSVRLHSQRDRRFRARDRRRARIRGQLPCRVA